MVLPVPPMRSPLWVLAREERMIAMAVDNRNMPKLATNRMTYAHVAVDATKGSVEGAAEEGSCKWMRVWRRLLVTFLSGLRSLYVSIAKEALMEAKNTAYKRSRCFFVTHAEGGRTNTIIEFKNC